MRGVCISGAVGDSGQVRLLVGWEANVAVVMVGEVDESCERGEGRCVGCAIFLFPLGFLMSSYSSSKMR